ncbi:unnamed protein product [Chironomus riparius]|uniref:Peroxidase n=1 Tax=Chironomus riparius TaxID=315576 RepID=A0A9N9S5Q0_9DIPT|nr:unnamed protein product [Chironomus riparius]
MILFISIASLLAVNVIGDNCVTHHYRTLDGSCNNLVNRDWGAAGTKYGRLLPPNYSDGIHAPPKSVTGQELPSARVVSTTVFGRKDVPDPNHTIVMMQFGQFVAHDMAFTGGSLNPPCCDDGKVSSHESHCFNIPIPVDDPIHSSDGVECMKFQRTLTDKDNELNENESNQPAEQITVVTGFLDLSLIYGNSEKELDSIREYNGGRLIMEKRNGKEWPPHHPNGDNVCYVETPGETCYFGGDPRLNQSPDLTILHIFYIREHNRLADILSQLNPNWTDEKVFQEARRINIAQYQYVVYYEWLPLFLGEENMYKAKMLYYKDGSEYVNDYDASVDPAVYNDHSSTAFRYYHSSIEGHLKLMSESRETTETLRISNVFLRPRILEKDDNYDSFGRGMATQSFQKADKNFDIEVKEFLLRHLKKYGDDIRAIDVQRGRDHGIATYNEFRELCGLPKATKWEDYLDLISEEDLGNLKSVYPSYEDVELSVGGILESRLDKTVLAGPTYQCIYMKQFYKTRVADRYWFETGDEEVALKPDQLAEIRKLSMARMFCDNGNNISSMQPNAFITLNDENKVVPCSEIPAVDYTLWQEEKVK